MAQLPPDYRSRHFTISIPKVGFKHPVSGDLVVWPDLLERLKTRKSVDTVLYILHDKDRALDKTKKDIVKVKPHWQALISFKHPQTQLAVASFLKIPVSSFQRVRSTQAQMVAYLLHRDHDSLTDPLKLKHTYAISELRQYGKRIAVQEMLIKAASRVVYPPVKDLFYEYLADRIKKGELTRATVWNFLDDFIWGQDPGLKRWLSWAFELKDGYDLEAAKLNPVELDNVFISGPPDCGKSFLAKYLGRAAGGFCHPGSPTNWEKYDGSKTAIFDDPKDLGTPVDFINAISDNLQPRPARYRDPVVVGLRHVIITSNQPLISPRKEAGFLGCNFPQILGDHNLAICRRFQTWFEFSKDGQITRLIWNRQLECFEPVEITPNLFVLFKKGELTP